MKKVPFLVIPILLFIIIPEINAQTASEYIDPVVILETTQGKIVIGFFPNDAPNHVQNFLKLSLMGFYDDTIFHRIIPGFMIQGGDPNTISGDPNTWGIGGPDTKLKAEFNSIKHNRGIVSMARAQDPDSAGSQFFIVHKDSNFLDEQYTVFGRLVTEESFNTLDKIANIQTNSKDQPLNPDDVKIIKVTISSRNEIENLLPLTPPERVFTSTLEKTPNSYKNSQYDITFDPPEGWLLQQPQKINESTPDVVAVGPISGKTNPQIYLTIVDSKNQTFEQILDEINSTISDYEKNENFTIVLKEKTNVNGMQAFIVDATEFSEQINALIKFRSVTIYGETEYYILTYANDIEYYDSDFSKFTETLNSFNKISNQENSIDSKNIKDNSGGGCLIATATFDSELAPQVQKLREIRDSKLLQTESGSQFISSFNQFYYSFSPYVADYERENPIFKEIVKIGITPMITTLSIMDYADNESQVLGYGISLILMNVGMYFVAPALIIYRIRKLF